MRSQIEAAAALVAALGLHTAFFMVYEPGVDGQFSGQGGDALVTIGAASPSLSDLVAGWEEVPEPVDMPATPTPPPPVTEAPPQVARPVPEPAPQMQRPEFDMPSAPEIPSVPVAELPPPPPPEPEPLPEPEPVVEPEPEPEPEPEQIAEPSPEIPPIRPEPRPPVPETPAPTRQPQPAGTAPAGTASEGQRAAGSGGGPIAGNSGPPGATRTTRAIDPRVSWGSAIRARIERQKRYPRSAGNATGTVILRLVMTRSGQLASMALLQSSGNPDLDQAALRAVQAVRSFPAAPSAITDANTTFNLPINFLP